MNYPTWSDLNSEAIVPPLGARHAPDMGPVAVLVSTGPDFKRINTLVAKGRTCDFFMGTLTIEEGPGGISVAGPYIGSPYGVMLLESLAARGVRQVVVLGWCGSLTSSLETGDLVIPDRAFVDEGTSRHYRVLDPDLPQSDPHAGLSDRLRQHLAGRDIPVSHGPVWTTDAIYRETRNKVDWFRERGALAVEMECSALFSAARFRGIEVTALLVVSDSLASADWDPGFRKKQFKQARGTACREVVDFSRALSRAC